MKSIPEKMFRQRFVGLSAGDVNALKASGNKVACHSFRHDILSKLDSAQLDADFVRCAAYSETYNSNIYSYPFGGVKEVSPSVIRACEKYGYSGAVLNYDCSPGNRFAMGRISLGNLVNRYFIEARLSGFERFIKRVLRPIRPDHLSH
jgi:peptidoglycan/xylan/chitin deacetylase (PgdA/CDA1 family)